MAVTLVNFALPPFLVANHWLDLTASWRATAAPGSLADGSWLLTVSPWEPCSAGPLFVGDGGVVPAAVRFAGIRSAVRGVPCWRSFSFPWRARNWSCPRSSWRPSLANFTVPVLFQVRVFTEDPVSTRASDATGALRGHVVRWLLVPVVVLAVFRGGSTVALVAEFRGGLGFFCSQLGGVVAGCEWVTLRMGLP